MECLSIKRTSSLIVFTLTSLIFFSGCQSTASEDLNAECPVENTTNCPISEDNGDDRGYNPCLVNKALPVCKND